MSKIKLVNNYEIPLVSIGSMSELTCFCADTTKVSEVIGNLTDSNVINVKIYDDLGNVTGSYENMVRENVSISFLKTGYNVKFPLRSMTDTEIEMKNLRDGQKAMSDMLNVLIGGVA